MRVAASFLLVMHLFNGEGVCFVVLAQSDNHNLTCLSCTRATVMNDCYGSIPCADHEECFMDELITPKLTIEYTGGCRDTLVCRAGVQGKRRSDTVYHDDLVACSRCCNNPSRSGELDCNARLCGIRYLTTTTSPTPLPSSLSTVAHTEQNQTVSSISSTDLVQTASSQTTKNMSSFLSRTSISTESVTMSTLETNTLANLSTVNSSSALPHTYVSSVTTPVTNGHNNNALYNFLGTPVINLTVSLGSEISLGCGAANQQEISSYTWEKVNSCNNWINSTGSNLNLTTKATVGDSGTYICTVQYSGGRFAQEIFHITIKSNTDSCAFDQGTLCTWEQASNDDFDWTFQSGPTQTDNTGPDNDHSLGTDKGTYLFIESSAPRKEGEYAILISQLLPAGHTHCVSLWYSMYGSGIGTLKIIKNDCHGNKSELWSKSGGQGEQWNKMSIDLSSKNNTLDYNIEIIAYVGSNYTGDIAIDDVNISSIECSG